MSSFFSFFLSSFLLSSDVRTTDTKLLGYFDVDAVKNIDWPAPEDAMKQVILSNEQESLLLANCRDEKSVQLSPDWVADPVGQKGAGKLFLLHGTSISGRSDSLLRANFLRKQVLRGLGKH